MNKYKYFAVLLLTLNALAFKFNAIVMRVHDGDTITIKSELFKSPKNIRMIGIDTPEVDFNGFSQGDVALGARDYLLSLIPIGSEVVVDLGDNSLEDRRLLATIYYQNQNINKEMLISGFAAPYIIAPFDKTLMRDYLETSKIIFENKKTIFIDNIQLPYEFRMSVQNRVGTNYVGNYETKVLYSPEDTYLVPPYNRVFFSTLDYARRLGYLYNK